MCRDTEKKCMHYENGIKDEKNIWKNLSLTWHNQGRKEGREEGRLEGREEGRLEGSNQKTVELVTKKYQKGDSVSKIAEDLLMSVEEVEEILGKMTVSQ